MSWRDTIKKDKPMKTWRDTITKDRFVVQGIDGKDFEWSEHESKIFGLIKKYIDSLKDKFFSEIKREILTSDKFKGEKGQDGRSIKGEKGDKGKDGNKWHLYSKDLEASEGDFALSEDGKIYVYEDGEWSFKFQLKGKDNRLAVGGITEQFVIDYVAANGGGGGSVSQNIVSTTVDLTLTDEDFVIAKGTNPLTISLKNASSAVKSVVVKNRTNQMLTINVDGGANIDDNPEWEISPNTAFEFVPQGGQYYAY